MNKIDMFLESASGYYYPFSPGSDEKEVTVMLDYGEQVHPVRGGQFFHHGIDYMCDHLPLYAVASGVVIGVGDDAERGKFIAIRYGRYVVRYAHCSEFSVDYGRRVSAGEQVAISGHFLHIDVTFDGEDLDPKDFIAIINANLALYAGLGVDGPLDSPLSDIPIETPYDADQDEIQGLMAKYIASYMNDIRLGKYVPSPKVSSLLSSTFSDIAAKEYFYEEIPNVVNPVGISERGGIFAGAIQTILIEDFLNYMARVHHVYLSSWSDEQKKSFAVRHRRE